jgi:hypothetical protein
LVTSYEIAFSKYKPLKYIVILWTKDRQLVLTFLDLVEQQIALQFLFSKGLRDKSPQADLPSSLREQTYSFSETKRCVRRFKEGDRSCDDEARSVRSLSDLTDGIFRDLEKLPFASAKVLVKHFSSSLPTIPRILKKGLGLNKFLSR